MRQMKTISPSTAALLRVKLWLEWLDLGVNCVPGLRKDLNHILNAAFAAKGRKERVR